MSVNSIRGIFVDLPPTSKTIMTQGLSLSTQRAPTDPLFKSVVKLVSLLNGFTYSVKARESEDVASGSFTSSPTYLDEIIAYTESDQISVSYLKYGYKYTKAIFVITPLETLLFMSHVTNTNVVLSEVDASNLTGITVDKNNKKVTVSESHTVSEVYDYLQYFQSHIDNIELLEEGEIFSTVLGNNYNLKDDWALVISADNTGAWNVTGDVILDTPVTITTFNLIGVMYFDTSGSYSIIDSSIASVDTLDGDEVVLIEPVGSTTISSNLDSTNITINTPAKVLTFTGLKIGTDVVIQSSNTGEVLNSVDQVAVDNYSYVYSTSQSVTLGFIKAGFTPLYIYNYPLSESDVMLPITQVIDRNYAV